MTFLFCSWELNFSLFGWDIIEKGGKICSLENQDCRLGSLCNAENECNFLFGCISQQNCNFPYWAEASSMRFLFSESIQGSIQCSILEPLRNFLSEIHRLKLEPKESRTPW